MMNGRVLVPGRGAVGPVAIDSARDATGLVLVLEYLRTDDVGRISLCSAIIVEDGCSCDHASMICRTLGVSVVQLRDATTVLRDGQMLCVDGHAGGIEVDPPYSKAPEWVPELTRSAWARLRPIRFQVGVLDERCVRAVNALRSSSVEQFFVRHEFVWLMRNECPFLSVQTRGIEATADLIYKTLLPITAALEDGQLLNFRSLDARSDEYHSIIKDPDRGPERNPQTGLHGIRHLLSRQELLKAELLAVDALRKSGHDNVVFSLPFLTQPAELDAVKRIASAACTTEPPIGLYIETPAAVYRLGELLERRPRSLCVGTKDLAQLILGCDRTEPGTQYFYNLADPAVIAAISDVVSTCSAASAPVYVYTDLDHVEAFLERIPLLDRLSVTRGEYQLIASGLNRRDR
jgi:phosphoenolpyruvate-protein kinase (PTS system EI component)